jgi:hypothetical protein
MKYIEKGLSIDTLFRGLKRSNIEFIKTLLPNDDITPEILNDAINKLSPEHQWIIDIYLEKALRIQRIRYYIKKSLLISVLIVAAVFILLVLIVFII